MGHVGRMRERRGAYSVLVRKPEGKKSTVRHKCRWVDNITVVLQENCWGCWLDWSGLGHGYESSGIIKCGVKRLKVKVRRAYNRRKLGEQYQQQLKRLSCQRKEMHRKHSCAHYYKMKVKHGRNFTDMLKDVKGIGRIYLRSETVMDSTSKTRRKGK
jgi:hypothetical protein